MKNLDNVLVFSHSLELFQFAADDFKNRALAAVKNKKSFSVVLSGGTTPSLLFDKLASDPYKTTIPWEHIRFFFGDERYVPANDPKSNYKMANDHLFSKVAVNPNYIYRIPTESNNPQKDAKEYEQLIRNALQIEDAAYPSFDLIYLGLGDDAHTASLMPESDIVKFSIKNAFPGYSHSPIVASLFIAHSNMHRITLTPNAINSSQCIIFLTTGARKAEAVAQVLEGLNAPERYPAQLIQGVKGPALWYLDEDAACKLSRKSIKAYEIIEKNA